MKDKDRQHFFTRRTLILGGIQGGLALGLIGRLYVLQVLNRQHYQLLSDKNRIQSVDLLPIRGKVFDRTGVLLAGNYTTYSSLINVQGTKEVQQLLENLKNLIVLDDLTLERINSQLKKRRKAFALLLKENLSWEELATLELHSIDFPELNVEKSQTRFYQHPFETAHILGYVAAVSEKEIEQEPALGIPGLKVGKSGIEKNYDKHLRGETGSKRSEINAKQKVVRTLETIDCINGQDLNLTIDFNLQKSVREILQKTISSSAVVLDVNTGAILALVSHPTFDANLFTNGISRKDWKKIIEQPGKPMNNKVISGQYGPGSTFKMCVALAGLRKGVIQHHTTFHCPGYYDFYNHRFHCWNWKTHGHGKINLQDAISQSCDVYFYQLALLIGVDGIAEVAREFGLGEKTGIDFPDEKKGLIPSRHWKKMTKGQGWSPGETINVSIGQGSVLATPLQLAKMIATMANGFRSIQPHLVKTGNLSVDKYLDYPKEHQELIRRGMWGTVNDPKGNAYKARTQIDNFEMIGKTGSTQVSRITQTQRDENTHNDRPYHLREHAIFVGYAPFKEPKFAVTVVVEHGGGGAKTAAPLARDILIAAHQLIKSV